MLRSLPNLSLRVRPIEQSSESESRSWKRVWGEIREGEIVGVEVPTWLAFLVVVFLCAILFSVGWLVRDGKATRESLQAVEQELRGLHEAYVLDPNKIDKLSYETHRVWFATHKHSDETGKITVPEEH